MHLEELIVSPIAREIERAETPSTPASKPSSSQDSFLASNPTSWIIRSISLSYSFEITEGLPRRSPLEASRLEASLLWCLLSTLAGDIIAQPCRWGTPL